MSEHGFGSMQGRSTSGGTFRPVRGQQFSLGISLERVVAHIQYIRRTPCVRRRHNLASLHSLDGGRRDASDGHTSTRAIRCVSGHASGPSRYRTSRVSLPWRRRTGTTCCRKLHQAWRHCLGCGGSLRQSYRRLCITRWTKRACRRARAVPARLRRPAEDDQGQSLAKCRLRTVSQQERPEARGPSSRAPIQAVQKSSLELEMCGSLSSMTSDSDA